MFFDLKIVLKIYHQLKRRRFHTQTQISGFCWTIWIAGTLDPSWVVVHTLVCHPPCQSVMSRSWSRVLVHSSIVFLLLLFLFLENQKWNMKERVSSFKEIREGGNGRNEECSYFLIYAIWVPRKFKIAFSYIQPNFRTYFFSTGIC